VAQQCPRLVQASAPWVDVAHWVAATLVLSRGTTSGSPVDHTRDNRKLAAAAAADQLHPDDRTNGSPCVHRRSNRCSEVAADWRYPAVVDQRTLATTNVDPEAVVAAPAVDLTPISNSVSRCRCCPKLGNDNVGTLAQVLTDFRTAAAGNADHSNAAMQIPTLGAEDSGTLVLAVDQPEAGGHCCFPTTTTVDCVASYCDPATTRSPGGWTGPLVRPGNAACGWLMKHGWNPMMHYWVPVNPDVVGYFCPGDPYWQRRWAPGVH